jgi:MYXO-CTERM domain-containing protein
MVAVALLGCGPGPVVYDAVGADDAVDDLVYAMLLFGTTEPDADRIDALHVAGGSLEINVRRTRSIGGLKWSATTLDPDIAEVVAADTTADGLTLTLAFHRAGLTDLFILDHDGAVIDLQPLEVRDPASVDLVDWADLAAGSDDAAGDPVHVVAGTDPDLAVRWRDDQGRALVGGDLLAIDGTPATGVSAFTEFASEADVLHLEIDPDAPRSSFDLTLSAADATFQREFQVHPRMEVDRVELEDRESPDGGGVVRANVFAGADALAGADVVFSWDRDEATGTALAWEPGPTTTVQACFDQVCDSVVLLGQPTGVVGEPSGCGCGSTGPSAAPALVLAALAARRRQPRKG